MTTSIKTLMPRVCRPTRMSAIAAATAAATVISMPGLSSALPSDTTDPNYINSVFVPRDDTNGFRTLDIAGGMYVIGDSLSMSPGEIKVADNTYWNFNVPYAASAAQTLQHRNRGECVQLAKVVRDGVPSHPVVDCRIGVYPHVAKACPQL